MSDVPVQQPPSRSVFLFAMVGYIVCLYTRNGSKYSALMAQAAWETTGFTSNKWKRGCGAFGMQYSPTGTPGAQGANPPGTSGEPTAYYTGLWRYLRMWTDRLRWDVRRGIGHCKNQKDYRHQVVDVHKWLGPNSSEASGLIYKAGWQAAYSKLPGWIKVVGGPGEDDKPGLWRWIQVVFIIILTSAVIWGIVQLYRFITGKRKNRNG